MKVPDCGHDRRIDYWVVDWQILLCENSSLGTDLLLQSFHGETLGTLNRQSQSTRPYALQRNMLFDIALFMLNGKHTLWLHAYLLHKTFGRSGQPSFQFSTIMQTHKQFMWHPSCLWLCPVWVKSIVKKEVALT